MRYIKKFNESREEILDISDLRKIEQWIFDFSEKTEKLTQDQVMDIFTQIEEKFGQDIAMIIDSVFSADKLHYYQTGSTVPTGGIDTGDFIKNFNDIKEFSDSLLPK